MNQTLRAGDLDPSFGNGGHSDIPGGLGTSALRPDQKIVTVEGILDSVGIRVFRHLPDGTPDPLFGAEGKAIHFPHAEAINFSVLGCSFQSDGKIIVSGNLNFPEESRYQLLVARLHEDGQLDTGFGNAGFTMVILDNPYSNEIFGFSVQQDDRIVLCMRGSGRSALVRLASDGTLDPSFGVVGISSDVPPQAHLLGILPQSDGTLMLWGTATYDAPVHLQPQVSRYDDRGKPVPTFGDDGYRFFDYPEQYPGSTFWQAVALATRSDGKILVLGLASPPERPQTTWITRLETDGATDMTFNDGKLLMTPIGNEGNVAGAFLLQPDGKFIWAGYTGGVSKTTLERRLADGPRDPTFGNDGLVISDPPPGSLMAKGTPMLQADGKLLLSSRVLGALTGVRLSRYLL
ncbi:hypothetical protein [Pandoraea sp. PE-S2R-1]|uniref:hypothetical protein n=1 Tax=Pandoraea sp. PE-S2R-1 TaxID=1986994 RepID=UPI000B3FEAED|nr:hypothetical protein [Pandoraea sp. PE-S2R-1]